MAERTKLWIADKMKELMRDKPLDKIRVTEICEAAEIRRPTFYYHFKDKYDLVAWIFYHSAYRTDVISKESAAQAMRQMKRDFVFYKRAYEDTSQNALWQYLVEYFTARYVRRAKEILRTEVLDTQLSYSIRLYCYGTLGMSREWLLDDNTTSAETVVEMMFASMPENMRRVFFPDNAEHSK